ncbi:hemolysin III family protein [bacterium]|nr:hemolysin III family protein [bacterium]
MGWLILIAVKPILANVGTGVLKLLILGGVIYSVGGVIYTLRKPNLGQKFGYHELWYIMVLLGSLTHFLVMLMISLKS